MINFDSYLNGVGLNFCEFDKKKPQQQQMIHSNHLNGVKLLNENEKKTPHQKSNIGLKYIAQQVPASLYRL